jgi:hypothetical protein
MVDLEVALRRLQRARQVVQCIEVAATAEAEVELAPVAFVAVDIIDQVIADIAALLSKAAP